MCLESSSSKRNLKHLVNYVDMDGKSALFYAVIYGIATIIIILDEFELTRALLDKGARLDLRDMHDKTVLHYASMYIANKQHLDFVVSHAL